MQWRLLSSRQIRNRAGLGSGGYLRTCRNRCFALGVMRLSGRCGTMSGRIGLKFKVGTTATFPQNHSCLLLLGLSCLLHSIGQAMPSCLSWAFVI